MSTLYNNNALMLGALQTLFDAQFERDAKILGADRYKVLWNAVKDELTHYFGMYDYREHKPTDITVGMSIEFTIDGMTYTLEYGMVGNITVPILGVSNDNLNYKWLPKDKSMECDQLIQFNVNVCIKPAVKPITINFIVPNESDDEIEEEWVQEQSDTVVE